MSRKVLHLEIKATNKHKYYGSLVALWNDNEAIPYHTIKRLDLSNGWENKYFKIKLGRLITSVDVKTGKNNERSIDEVAEPEAK